MLLHSWWSHHLVILSVSPRNRNRSDGFRAGGTAPLVLAVPIEAVDNTWMRYWTQYLVPARGDSTRLATKWNRSDAPGCCCIAGGHIIW